MAAAAAIAKKRAKDAKRVRGLFKKYDLDNSNRIEREELSKMMMEVNNGEVPLKADVDFVLRRSDKSKVCQICNGVQRPHFAMPSRPAISLGKKFFTL